jgi:uncharacterized protein
MNLFYFGSRKRRLLGVFHPAQRARLGGRAVLLCYPWGNEYIYAHRSMTRLSNLLSQAGHHVLRFDYFGTGDSAGEAYEADLAGWRGDIETALEELRELSGATRATIVGLRLGAALGAIVADANRRAVEAVALWDPIVDGAEYVHAICQLDETTRISGVGRSRPRPAELGGGREVLGMPLTDRVAAELEALSVSEVIERLPQPLLVVATRSPRSYSGLEAALARRGEARLELMDDHAAWHEDWPHNAGAVSVKVLDRIVSWMQ